MGLRSAFENKTPKESVDIIRGDSNEVEVGTLSTWRGRLGETEVGLVVDKFML